MYRGKTALVSAHTKDDRLLNFVRSLVSMSWNILASAGTHRFLTEYNVPSGDIANIGGAPILGHRVVSLERKIHAALLSRPGHPRDQHELAELGIKPIELAYIDIGPLPQAMDGETVPAVSFIDMIDIGGPALLRSAAKGGRWVISNPHQYWRVLDALSTLRESMQLRYELAAAAEYLCAEYSTRTANIYAAAARHS